MSARVQPAGLLAVTLTLACGESGRVESAAPAAAPTVAAPSQDSALASLAAELLPAVERHSGVQAVRPPALASSSREKLESYLTGALAEQLPPERAAVLTAVYARLGLLPDTLQLDQLLRTLLLEQVAGYYDPRLDTLFVVDGVPTDQLEPVLVHELVHALQDQHTDLDSLTRALEGSNDGATAAQAAIEGHATYVMMEWLLSRQMGAAVDLTAMPDLAALLGQLDPSELAGAPVLGSAPRVVREALIFPYLGGLVFVQELWTEERDRPPPFGEYLPASTEQVLHAERFTRSRDRPVTLELIGALPDGWTDRHTDGLGELEIRILLEEHLDDRSAAETAAEGWDGDRYRFLETPRGDLFLWVTVWDTELDATEFESAARRALARRYGGPPPVGPAEVVYGDRRLRIGQRRSGGRAVVTVIDSPADLPASDADRALEFEIRGD